MSIEKQTEETSEMLEIIEREGAEYANYITNHVENEDIREGLLNSHYRIQSRLKQMMNAIFAIAEMAKILDTNGCTGCRKTIECSICRANKLYDAGYRKQEWISVKDRLPETTLQKIYIGSQDISSGEIVEEEERMVQKSEVVAVLDKRWVGGTADVYIDLDYLIDGQWAYNLGVTHWMPLPEAPKMKGGAE